MIKRLREYATPTTIVGPIVATHNAIKDIHNYLWISIIAALYVCVAC